MLKKREGLVLLGNEYNHQDPAARATDMSAKTFHLGILKKNNLAS